MGGFPTLPAFKRALLKTLQAVCDHYTALFEAAPSLTAAVGNLVFTGDDDDPETLATLSQLGYGKPAEVTRTVRGWHYGRYPAVRSAAARERLTEFLPALIQALATTDNADAALNAFDRFLSRMPAGVQLFSLLGSNPDLFKLLAMVMGTAPRLAETVIHRAHVLDALTEPEFFGRLPDRKRLTGRLAASLDQAQSYEDVLDRARVFGQEQQFLIGIRVLAGTVAVRQAGYAYTDLAEVLLAALLSAVRDEFARAHGRMKGGQVALVAMGKLGGREMTAASDLDLILLYDFNDKAAASDGDRPLAGVQYFGRLTQRLLAALSAPTAEGTLYEVDFRLRPSGQSGPLATHIDSFAAYQEKGAWTWEHMALTRARVIAGDKRLVARAESEIAKAVIRKRDRTKVTRDILEMRAMVEAEKGGEGAWDLKQAPGGLVDIEFIAQFLLLIHAAKHKELLSTETDVVLTAATKARLLPAREAEALLPALRLYQALIQISRLCVDGPFDPEVVPGGLLDRLALAGELPDFKRLDAHLRETQATVRESFERLIGKVPKAGSAKPGPT
jgi:glutamate-ammonia-ligase adenylyltransferase